MRDKLVSISEKDGIVTMRMPKHVAEDLRDSLGPLQTSYEVFDALCNLFPPEYKEDSDVKS